MQKKHRESLKDLRAKLFWTTPQKMKHLKQTVKRKDATIQVLRQAMKDRGLSKLAEAKFEIKRWKKKHQKLKNETKERHASLSAASQADEDITRLTSELKEKDDIIKNLENEKLMLEETVEQLNTSMEQEKRGTRDEKTY